MCLLCPGVFCGRTWKCKWKSHQVLKTANVCLYGNLENKNAEIKTNCRGPAHKTLEVSKRLSPTRLEVINENFGKINKCQYSAIVLGI